MSSTESSPHPTPAETDCLVCGSGKSVTKNPILFCDGPGCDIPVHQKCYGVKLVPEGNWYCQRCEDHIPVSNTPSCCCPQRTGAFKRTTIPNQYIHVACARMHSNLDETEDPIAFSPSLTKKQICCLCKSNHGICSQCSVDSCSRVMHVTCAQNEALMTKGKSNSLFCDLHRDIGALSRIIKKTQEHQHQKHPRSSSSTSSGFHRSTKRSRSYRESSIETEDEVDDDEDDDDDVVEDDDNASDGDVLDPTADDDSEDDRRRSKSASSSSATSTPGARGHSKSKRSVDSTERRRRERSSDSEEIDVDDTEAVLGSSTGGGSGSTAQRKKLKSGNIKGPKESAAESQRRRLLMSLDKSKKKQGTSSGSGLNNIANLSAMPIRTLGGLGAPASTVPNAETKQKLPGISRYGYNNSSNTSLLSNDNPSPNPYASGNGLSPSTSSTERFSGNGYNQSSGRGPNEGSGRNLKGLAFDLHPGLDVTTFKGASPLLGSVSASPVVSSFSNSGSPVHARMGDKQQYSPKSGSGLFEDSKDAQNLIRTLQAKLANQESTIQAMTLQTQQLQKQLSNGNSNGNDNHSINGAPTSHTLSSSVSAPSVTHQHHTSGTPGQDLQHRLDRLQHTHAEEKMRNLTLRQNLRDLFGFLQVPVTTSPATGGDSHSTLQLDWNSEKLDDYVQALRDSVVGPEPSRSTLDVKKRDMVVDKVLREIGG